MTYGNLIRILDSDGHELGASIAQEMDDAIYLDCGGPNLMFNDDAKHAKKWAEEKGLTYQCIEFRLDPKKMVQKAFLVYQAGIANVFAVDCYNLAKTGRNARRLYQGAFSEAVHFARGLAAAGVGIKTAACNRAGDIVDELWSEDFDSQPFSDKFRILDENNRG